MVQNRAVGIVLLVVILAALLILGCWFFKKRSGYKIIRVRLFPAYFQYFLGCKLSFPPFVKTLCSFLCAFLVPFYFFTTNPKSVSFQSPRPGSPSHTEGQYSEAGPSAENKMALTDFGSFRPVVRHRKLPHGCLDRASIVSVVVFLSGAKLLLRYRNRLIKGIGFMVNRRGRIR